MFDAFLSAAHNTAQVCAGVAGCVSVLLAHCLVFSLVILLACAAFDRVTRWIASRWRRKGRKPGSRIARIILAHVDDQTV